VSQARPLHRHTYADYVALEKVSAEKHEYLEGQIYVMAGGSEDHSKIAVNVTSALHRAVREPCYAHSSDLRVYVESVGLATFPDASVICGPLQQHAPSPDATALNPTILVEVTSDSSEEYDTITKLEYYRTIPALRDYMIVSHRAREITVHSRGMNDTWATRVVKSGQSAELPSLGIQLNVDEIYRGSTIISAD
jgi:Uma2 family endonuclease